jgi:hypothetical protein
METKTYRNEKYQLKNGRIITTSLRTFDFNLLIDHLKRSHSWSRGDLCSMVLIKRSDKQIILTLLPKETDVKFFRNIDSTSFQVIEGRLKFHTITGSIILNAGQFHTFQDNTAYHLTSLEESVFLLTIVSGVVRSNKILSS